MKNKNTIHRRDFLKISTLIGAGTLLSPATIAASLNRRLSPEDQPQPIPRRALGKTGARLPILSMGVMRADNPNLLRAAYNAGIYHFDTAHGYQNGRNEEMIGNFFQDKPRDSFFIASKIKSNYPLRDNFEQDLNEKLDVSLKRLKMPYLDILYMHAFASVNEVNDPRIIAAMQKIKEEGKTRFIGFSTHAHKPEMIDAAARQGLYDVILVSYNFKLHNAAETTRAIQQAANAGIGIIAMKTMTGGREDPQGQRKINARACLRWAWENESIATAIPGFTNFDELDECLAAAQAPALTTDDQHYLADLQHREMLFCQRCESCVATCPKHLPIPDIMRAYMYAHGYKQASLSRETLMDLDINAAPCSGCTACTVKCPSGFDVQRKIAAIAPVLNVPAEFLS
ncbi:MAG: aldo/keto reductase [Odoribacteraceae bacterium]|jgi:predicted aldo/keto reductase-like oxidoreductase|nr:aldo/keto reductase [Odoribacteraceae bacterium]